MGWGFGNVVIGTIKTLLHPSKGSVSAAYLVSPTFWAQCSSFDVFLLCYIMFFQMFRMVTTVVLSGGNPNQDWHDYLQRTWWSTVGRAVRCAVQRRFKMCGAWSFVALGQRFVVFRREPQTNPGVAGVCSTRSACKLRTVK